MGDYYRRVEYHGRPRETTGGPRETTEAISRAQILAQYPESSPLPTPPGPLKLSLFGGIVKSLEKQFLNIYLNQSQWHEHI